MNLGSRERKTKLLLLLTPLSLTLELNLNLYSPVSLYMIPPPPLQPLPWEN